MADNTARITSPPAAPFPPLLCPPTSPQAHCCSAAWPAAAAI